VYPKRESTTAAGGYGVAGDRGHSTFSRTDSEPRRKDSDIDECVFFGRGIAICLETNDYRAVTVGTESGVGDGILSA
jgi:hypothetical protein